MNDIHYAFIPPVGRNGREYYANTSLMYCVAPPGEYFGVAKNMVFECDLCYFVASA